jgi:hypothetical protein
MNLLALLYRAEGKHTEAETLWLSLRRLGRFRGSRASVALGTQGNHGAGSQPSR